MKKEMIKRLSALVLCLVLIVMAILPVAATTPEEDREQMIEDTISVRIFWIIYVFVALILPAALIGVGVMLARSETRGKPTYWYGLSMVCGVWLLLSIALMVVLLAI